jgi:hypothetical protein
LPFASLSFPSMYARFNLVACPGDFDSGYAPSQSRFRTGY